MVLHGRGAGKHCPWGRTAPSWVSTALTPALKDRTLPSWMAFLRGHGTSGAGVSRGSFSSLSLELLSLSESEELSESLVLSDSALLECADATGSGSDCGALQSNQRIKLEGTMQVGFLPSLPPAHFPAIRKGLSII